MHDTAGDYAEAARRNHTQIHRDRQKSKAAEELQLAHGRHRRHLS